MKPLTRKRSVKALLAGIRINSSVTSDVANSISGFLNCAISRYNWAIGGVRIPAQQIECSASDKGELMANTQMALGYFNQFLYSIVVRQRIKRQNVLVVCFR